MSLLLILTRHAKSSWKHPGLDDHDRPLNRRGRESAAIIGRWLSDRGYSPDLVLSSTSARTCETWERMSDEFGDGAEMRREASLYHADPAEILSTLRGAGTAGTLLVLGHNPGIGEAADMLAAVPPNHPEFERYPTAATTVFEFDIPNWSEADRGMGRIADFIAPRMLGRD